MQPHVYDDITARHYAAYRPPLHTPILTLGLNADERFEHALDVGCGTGNSTHALSRWCDLVVGRDISTEMIALAQPAAGVSFQLQPGENIAAGLGAATFDLVTFAGCLPYLNPAGVAASLKQLLVPGGTVLVYDFEILLHPVFDHLGILLPQSDYDHAVNLNAQKDSLRLVRAVCKEISFSLTNAELAHLLCSVQEWREGSLINYRYEGLVEELPAITSLPAKIWLTRYAG